MTGAHILLVQPADGDDVPPTRLRDSGLRVTTATSATDALATLSEGEFDCLVSVYELPGDDGLSLFEAVRTLHDTLPFVLYAASDASLADEALSSGVDRFVSREQSDAIATLVEEVTGLTASVSELPRQQDISGHEPSTAEIVRAIDEAPIGVSLCDPSLPDYPMVYVNDAWEEVTGYPREEALGRNPRMLQGPKTDEERIASLSSALENEQEITVELRNYRRDGTPFWNELRLAPIYDDSGDLSLYVGFQNDVTDRRNAEQLATERAFKLTDEKRTLRRILERVSGLLNNITQILAEQNERQFITQQVCDRIVTEDGYTAAWFGSLDTTGTELEIEAAAGIDPQAESSLPADEAPSTVADAIDSGTLEVSAVSRSEGDSNPLSPVAVDARRLLALPVSYERKNYGVLVVYADGVNALDRREQQLFDSIGSMIGSRLNAIETAQILTADRVIELEISIRDESFPLSAIAGMLGTEVEYVGMTADSDAGAYELFLTAGESVETDAVTDLPFVQNVRRISVTDSTRTFAVAVDSGSPFTDLADHGGSVAEVNARGDAATLSLELPPEQDVRSMLGLLEDRYETVELWSRREREGRAATMNEFASEVDEQLTARQRSALQAAHMNGYFEWPRPTDGAEIADTMGITRQTFHQHLRAAERKLIDAYVERYADSATGTPIRQQTD